MKRKNLFSSLFLGSFIIVMLSGCVHKHQNVTEAHDVVNVIKTKNYTLNTTVNSLADQIFFNKKIQTDKPVIVTSFVQLDKLDKTSEFGRVIGESLINELSNRGFNIIEFRGQMAVSINDDGEYFLTRKVQKLKGKVPNTYVVVGTYSRQEGRVILNTRVIDNITGKIITSARTTYVHNMKEDCLLFKDCQPLRTIKLVEEK